ncbi:MAG TPA: SDR family NAD(P)-dependent oxidoreductase [Bacteroidetes bacterium]|nr:SDR family NAD(P)-dependent oxidoreductase [Bacteroidota bacterium]
MKKVIIVGATSGIGRELARVFVAKGYQVGVAGRRSELLAEIKEENPKQYFTKQIDVSDTEALPLLLNSLARDLGGMDILINCAGVGKKNEELDFAIDKMIVETNVVGFTAVIDWAYNYLINKCGGQIVNISSVSGIRGHRFGSFSYSASKSYQMRYLEGLRHKLVKANIPIYVTDIRPGFVDTDMIPKNRYFWVISANKAARLIFKSITRKRNVAYITKRWIIIVAIIKIFPGAILNRI